MHRSAAIRVSWMLAACVASVGCRSRPAATPDAGPSVQLGLASHYHRSLAGRRTASGEPYRPGALTAAHRSLPLGTVVRVTRLDGAGAPLGAPVTVRINDRGPYVRGRVLDLSHEAARRLDMLRPGVVPVRIEVLAPRGAAASTGHPLSPRARGSSGAAGRPGR